MRLRQGSIDFRGLTRADISLSAAQVKLPKMDNFVLENLTLRLAMAMSLSQAQIGVDCLAEVNSDSGNEKLAGKAEKNMK